MRALHWCIVRSVVYTEMHTQGNTHGTERTETRNQVLCQAALTPTLWNFELNLALTSYA